ncbi:hypothetical protein B0H13DRAFT_1901841 [Mycena leptocephala]|nr:hypothetical protein B0H13DRAFT_1901841 [Mycena leptocephala]
MLEVADDTQVASNMRRYVVFPGAAVHSLSDISAEFLTYLDFGWTWEMTLEPTSSHTDPSTIGSPFDYDGADFLATAILTGLSSWFAKLDEDHWAVQPWPRSVELLPNTSACAAGTFERILPWVYQHAQLNIAVDAY